MKVKKVFKIIGIILLVVIVLLLIHTIRNFIIIRNLQNNIAKYVESTNYHIKSITVEEGGTSVTIDYYKKDDNHVIFHKKKLNDEFKKISMYENEWKVNVFIDTEDSKKVWLNAGTIPNMNIVSQLTTDNNLQTLFMSIIANIKSTKVNNKDCYAITNLLATNIFSKYEQIEYIEKGTGLSIKTKTNFMLNEKEYEFNNVDDSIFTEPSINEYEII